MTPDPRNAKLEEIEKWAYTADYATVKWLCLQLREEMRWNEHPDSFKAVIAEKESEITRLTQERDDFTESFGVNTLADVRQLYTNMSTYADKRAEQEMRNRQYYRGLVVQIGETFGEAARIQDDGGIVEDVLCAKVPELVAKEILRLRGALEKMPCNCVKYRTSVPSTCHRCPALGKETK